LADRRRGRSSEVPGRSSKYACTFCADGTKIDYKDVELLRGFLSPEGQILPRRRTGTCPKHQRRLAQAVKRARHLALLPHAPQHTYEYG